MFYKILEVIRGASLPHFWNLFTINFLLLSNFSRIICRFISLCEIGFAYCCLRSLISSKHRKTLNLIWMAASLEPPSTLIDEDQYRVFVQSMEAQGAYSPPGPSSVGIVDFERPDSRYYLCESDIADLTAYESAAGAAKKPVWNKSSSGAAGKVGAVMGAESWPALSDTARGSPKSPLVSSNGQGVVVSDTSISSGGYSMNHIRLEADGTISQAPCIIGALAESQQQNAGNYGQRERSFGGNEQQSQHGSFRGNNNGPQARPDGSYRHRHGGRRDHNRREGFASQKRDGSRPFVRGPAPNWPFVPPPVVMRPFVNPMVYHEMPQVFFVPGPHLDSPRPPPMVSYTPLLFPVPDPHLLNKILNQINYYFSNENLVKDIHLRRNMDSEGWVSVHLIAGFNKVRQLTNSVHLILDALQASYIIEVQGDKVRRRGDWLKWLIPPTQNPTTSPAFYASSQYNYLEDID
ncbi:la-related protein 1C-like isoform X1 [Salvia splendens]|uniref:la-related protein 1C-like isoform X1 n=2 Tax=Salvia splendens TaxID=180675 RepID=UPI001C267FB1|nr:la-related protein 1C-like isoform X1 [Salvia splendens]